MASNETSELFGKGESHHEVGNREKEILLILKPCIGLIVLAFGTVPVLAGMIAVVVLLARVAEVDLAAESIGAALFDGLHGLEMAGKHTTGKFLPVLGSMTEEDIGDFHHLKDPP